jgi:hypothetical protein
VADLDVAGAVYDDRGERVSEIVGESSRLKLPLENPQPLREQGLFYEKALALGPGTYQVRLGVRGSGGSLLGSATEWVVIPDRGARALTLSSIFLQRDDGRENSPSPLEDVQVEKRFGVPRVELRGPLYRSDSAGRGKADVVMQAQVWRADRLLGAGPAHEVVFPGPGGAPPSQAERIATEPLDPGVYELRIVANDRGSGEKATARVSFTVE